MAFREQPDAFPRFRDADLEVIISPTRRYELHSTVLKQSSTLFAELMRVEGPRLTKKAQASGQTVRYCLQLTLSQTDQTYRFRRVELNTDGRRTDGSFVGTYNENGKVPPAIFRHYDMLFAIIYNVDLDLDRESIGAMLRDAMGIIQVAEYTGSVSALDTSNLDCVN